MARLLIVEARFYDHLNDLLIDGATAAAVDEGHHVEVVTVPGALEIPAAIALAAETGRYDAYVALGVVIRGILTVENEAQALARARPDDKDKGGEATKAALAMMKLRERFAG